MSRDAALAVDRGSGNIRKERPHLVLLDLMLPGTDGIELMELVPELMRTFIKKLRRKLGDDAARPACIRTERGVGYRMARPGSP